MAYSDQRGVSTTKCTRYFGNSKLVLGFSEIDTERSELANSEIDTEQNIDVSVCWYLVL
jgi:hypothetical protein